jgi:hypothetical protein
MYVCITDEVCWYPSVAEPPGGSVVDEVVAVGREVRLDDGVDAVVVAGIHDGVAEHDEGRRLLVMSLLLVVGVGPVLLLLLGNSCSRGVGSCCSTNGGSRSQQDEQQEQPSFLLPHFWCIYLRTNTYYICIYMCVEGNSGKLAS